MSSRWPLFAVVALLGLAGCKESGGSEAEREGENADKPAAQTVSAFYEAADEPDGEKACSLLTADGIRAIVRVGSHAACVRTIDGFDSGSFSDENGELLKIEGVEEHGATTDVNALLKGRSGGVYTVVKTKKGRLLIDGFKPEEG
ncbi:MAG: hypothetical protein WCF27_05630 [Gaiellaceae bacterium]